ncbi:hypothetical protein TNCV_1266331 [Trichonephila clavipes]|nr:hypothetical protein TNCV_1266331 [Trichonephila clavipes]
MKIELQLNQNVTTRIPAPDSNVASSRNVSSPSKARLIPLVPSLPQTLAELKERISTLAEVQTIDKTMLQIVRNKLDYRLDVYRVTLRAYIEHS